MKSFLISCFSDLVTVLSWSIMKSVSEGQDNLDKAAEIIVRLGLKACDVGRYEDCEALADMMTEEVMNLIKREDLKTSLRWLKKAHDSIPSVDRSRRSFVDLTARLFDEVGGAWKVELYHELEGICHGISFEALELIDDKELRGTIDAVKHVHDDYIERKANLVRKIG